MKTFRIAALATLAVSIPSLAFAGVTFKNKDKKQVEITIKRAGSSQNTGVPGGVTMEIPGSPLTVIIPAPPKSKAPPQKVDAADGDTLVYSKGKLTKEANPDDAAEATPAPEATAAPEGEPK